MSRAEEGGGAPEQQQQRYPQGKEFYSSQMSLGNTKMLFTLKIAENQKGLLHPKYFLMLKGLILRLKLKLV